MKNTLVIGNMEDRQAACAASFLGDALNENESPAFVLLHEIELRPYLKHIGERWKDLAIFDVRSETDVERIKFKALVKSQAVAFFMFDPYAPARVRQRLVESLYARMSDGIRFLHRPLIVFEDAPFLLRGSFAPPLADDEITWIASGMPHQLNETQVASARYGSLRLALGWNYRDYPWLDALSFDGVSLKDTLRGLSPGIFLVLDGKRWTTVLIPHVSLKEKRCLTYYRERGLAYSEA